MKKYVIVENHLITDEMLEGDKKPTPIYMGGLDNSVPSTYSIISVDTFHNALKGHKKFTIEELTAEINLIKNGSAPKYSDDSSVVQRPFASKVLPCGGKLYRRKHGIRDTVEANSTKITQYVVPYARCKIDEIEIVGCTGHDNIDLLVRDTAFGSYSGYPNATLEQFGFNVCLADLFYSDTSNYDANLYGGMIIEMHYKNNEEDIKSIGYNIVLHEVK